jgi:hypothetical protein
MGGKMAKNKGAGGERELRDLLEVWAHPVTTHLQAQRVQLERTASAQSRAGGYDLAGLDWLAIEVKRVEVVALPSWWRQTLSQTKPDQLPFLAWRRNRTRWAFRVQVPHHGYLLVADFDEENARRWFQLELAQRLQGVAP